MSGDDWRHYIAPGMLLEVITRDAAREAQCELTRLPEFSCVFTDHAGRVRAVVDVVSLHDLYDMVTTTKPASVRFATGPGDDVSMLQHLARTATGAAVH